VVGEEGRSGGEGLKNVDRVGVRRSRLRPRPRLVGWLGRTAAWGKGRGG